MSNLPLFTTRLRFWEEAFQHSSSLVELRDGRLVLNESGYNRDPDFFINDTAPTERWIAFWKKVESLAVWKWKREYSRDMLDGSCWSLDLEHEGRRLATRGYNAWPKRFGLFSQAVDALLSGAPPRLSRARRRRLRDLRRQLVRERFNTPVVRLT